MPYILQVNIDHFTNETRTKFQSDFTLFGSFLECLSIVVSKGCVAVTKVVFLHGDFNVVFIEQLWQVACNF